MGFVANILSPIIQAVVYVSLICALGYGIYIGFKAFCPNIRWVWKYKVLRKKHDEKKILYCLDAYDKKMKPIEIKKAMYIAGNSFKDTDEMLYLYDKIFKKLEGGVK